MFDQVYLKKLGTDHNEDTLLARTTGQRVGVFAWAILKLVLNYFWSLWVKMKIFIKEYATQTCTDHVTLGSLALTVHSLIVPLTETPTMTSSCLLASILMHNALIHWCCSRETNVYKMSRLIGSMTSTSV